MQNDPNKKLTGRQIPHITCTLMTHRDYLSSLVARVKRHGKEGAVIAKLLSTASTSLDEAAISLERLRLPEEVKMSISDDD